jgi:hypothetical protein
MQRLLIACGVCAALTIGTASAAVTAEVSADNGLTWTPVTFVDGDAIGEDPVTFYDYRSASAHTGFEIDGKSIMFLYEYAGELSLFTIHDKETAAADGTIDQVISGLPLGWTHQVKDDQGNGGLNDVYTTTATSLTADWQWVDNTDGSALGLGDLHSLVGTVIDIDSSNVSGLNEWLYLGAGGATELTLDYTDTAKIRFLIPEPGSVLAGLVGLGLVGTLRRRFA